jgi:Protein of unknown function (DUF2905)
MSRTLIVIGLLVVAAGVLWPWLSKLPLGRLPGDIAVKTGNGGIYFPIVTCILISVLLSVIMWFMRK